MKYLELRKEGETIANSAKIEVIGLDGTAYKLFHKSFNQIQVYYEAMLQCIAAEQGVRTPKIYGVEQADERLCILSEYIEGKTIAQLMEEYPSKKEHYLELMADTQLSIHSHTVHDIKDMRARIERSITSLAELDEVRRYELQTRLSSMPVHDKFCHGNFGPDNMMIDDMDKIVVLDWVAAAKGNSGADIAKTYLKIALTSTELAEKYLTIICDKAGFERQYIYEWLPLMAVCELCEKTPTEKEKSLYHSWLDLV